MRVRRWVEKEEEEEGIERRRNGPVTSQITRHIDDSLPPASYIVNVDSGLTAQKTGTRIDK
ncbi:hypothetical protein PM082_004522 [Marasmius tenuissimus]|nr:hypothetical protein PM082_004522 [Marasmius tenuissimus]